MNERGKKAAAAHAEEAPDRRPLTERQARRLAPQAGVAVRDVAGRTIAELREELAWKIDLQSLLFRKVCGKVVRTNPATGAQEPVPGATVHVEDSDCNFVGYFPSGSPYGWLHPFKCRREVIATARTDECGEFCVWIPRFDIDWVVRWRLRYECYWDLFRKPTLADVLRDIPELFELPPRIGPPGPDPAPDVRPVLEVGVDGRRALEAAFGGGAAAALAPAARALGDRRAPGGGVELFPGSSGPPPAALALDDALAETVAAIRSSAGNGLHDGGDARAAHVALHELRWLPVLRCRWALHPTVVPILDVPDITFRVTQDVDGDGTEETIYSEGYFDVRWDAGPIPPVTLHAASFARSAPGCHRPEVGPCAEPQIVLVGDMPLMNPAGPGTYPFVDTSTGYAVRPNRPHPSGRVDEVPAASSAATAPLAGVLELWGCNQHTAGGAPANRYRILDSIVDPSTGTASSPQPIVDHWNNWRVVGSPPVLEWKSMTADAGGWYEVLDPADDWMPGENFLLEWHAPANGLHELTLELGHFDGSTTSVIGSAAPVRMRVDNSAPEVRIASLAWRFEGDAAWTPLPLNCPTIRRQGRTVELAVGFQAWSTHLRSLAVGASGCGSGNPELLAGFEAQQSGVPAGTTTSNYFHEHAGDNNVSVTARYRVPSSLLSGAYSVSVTAWSRAFNPDDGHVYEPTLPDVGYDPAPIWRHASLGIAIVD